jgi:DNA-directed RNA polymerase specialized sigma24 family protein
LKEDKNVQELKLLHENPERLLEVYQPVIEIIVSNFIKRGFFHPKDKMELVQEINLQLLEKKISKIKQHFNGTAQLRTYFSKVVYNACMEIGRKQSLPQVSEPEDYLFRAQNTDTNPHQKLALKEEMTRLDGCLKALPKMKLKATICLKAVSKIPFTKSDIMFLDTPKTTDEITAIKATLFEDYQHLLNKDIFDILVPLFNKVENKDIDGDTLRKWANQVLDRFIVVLNGNPPHAAYTRETLKTLLQYYFTAE